MYKILRREDLSSNVVLMDVEAPMVAKNACLVNSLSFGSTKLANGFP